MNPDRQAQACVKNQSRATVALTAVAPAIIYLNGVSSAGKSTLARVLVRAMEDPYCLVAMDEFEGMASRRFPIPDTQGLYPDV